MKHSWNHIIFRFLPFFFFRLVQIDLRSGVLLVFFCRRQEEKVPFYNQSFFVISPVRSNPFPQFFTGSFAVDFGITCGRGSFAVHFGDHLRSRDHLRLGITCGTVQSSYFVPVGRDEIRAPLKTPPWEATRLRPGSNVELWLLGSVHVKFDVWINSGTALLYLGRLCRQAHTSNFTRAEPMDSDSSGG